MAKKMVSVSLDQIKKCSTADNGLVMHRQKIQQCKIIGNVLSINEQSTKTTYSITDYTGPIINVVLWNSSEENRIDINAPPIMEQTYVKVFGQPRKDATTGEIFVIAFHVRPIENINEITIHLLEVVKHAKDLLKLKNEYLCKGAGAFGGNSNMGAISGGTSGNGQKSASANNASNISGLNDVQSLILKSIKDFQSDVGISLDEIYTSIRSVKQETIKQAVEFLCNEGHVYESIGIRICFFF